MLQIREKIIDIINSQRDLTNKFNVCTTCQLRAWPGV